MKKRLFQKYEIVPIFILILFSLFCVIQDCSSPFSNTINFSDSSIYQYIGKLIVDGGMPYRDAFDHKGPILYLITAFSVLINERIGIWLVGFGFMLLMNFYAYKICKILMGDHIYEALITALVVMSNITWVYWAEGTPDFYAGSISTAAAYILIKCFRESKVQVADSFEIGAIIAVAFWMKFTTVGLMGVLCMGLLVLLLKEKRTNDVVNSVTGFILAFSIISVPLMVWLIRNGAFEDFIADYFGFNLFYGNLEGGNLSRSAAIGCFVGNAAYLLSVGCGLIYLVIRDKKGQFLHDSDYKNDALLLTTLIALLVQTIICCMPGRSYQQYMAVLYPAFLILVSLGTKQLLKYSSKEKGCKALVGITIALIVVPNIVKTVGYQKQFLSKQDRDYILECLQPYRGSTIAVATPDECSLYMLNDSKSATKYPYIQADLGGDSDFWERYETQLSESLPKVIVWSNQWNIYDCLPHLYDCYELSETVGWRSIYILKTSEENNG